MITIIEAGVLTGIIASIIKGFSWIVKAVREHDHKKAKLFSGYWHTEGNINHQ